MARPAVAEIDLSALQHNLQRVKQRAPNSQVLAVIKANAYGHGAVAAGRALVAADAFAVACMEEALQLREGGITKPILLLEGVFDAAELPVAAEQQLWLVVHHEQQLQQLEAYESTPGRGQFKVWLKVDTGMHRLGMPVAAAVDAWQRLNRLGCVDGEPVYMTHLASADEPEHASVAAQLASIDSLAPKQAIRSIANSAGILAWPETHADWVRPGIMLYGAAPDRHTAADYGLASVMTLRSALIAVKTVAQGESVGYGGRWTAAEQTRIGVVAIGYADGYPRHAGNGTPVCVNGRVVPLIGRVSMDMICVNLQNLPDAQVGDPVELWGKQLSVNKVAESAGTIAYELLSQCRRVRRVYVGGDELARKSVSEAENAQKEVN